MSISATTWCWIGLVIGVLGSAVYSGLETGIYSVNRVRLHVRAHHKRRGAALLESLMAAPNKLLSTLLVWNNISNYVVSLSLAALLNEWGKTGWTQVAYTSVVLMPILLIFGEIVPKDLFRANADRLCVQFARFLQVCQWVMTVIPIVPLMHWISRAFARRAADRESGALHTMHPRRRFTAMLREGVGHGLISPYQSEMVDRALGMGHLQVRDVMIPWVHAPSIRADTAPENVWKLADRISQQHVVMLDASDHPIGVLDIDRVLAMHETSPQGLQSLSAPLAELEPETSCRAALMQLQKERCPLAIVSQAGRPIGLVSTKQLIEPLVGELEVW